MAICHGTIPTNYLGLNAKDIGDLVSIENSCIVVNGDEHAHIISCW
jgi:hypothetical protein